MAWFISSSHWNFYWDPWHHEQENLYGRWIFKEKNSVTIINRWAKIIINIRRHKTLMSPNGYNRFSPLFFDSCPGLHNHNSTQIISIINPVNSNISCYIWVLIIRGGRSFTIMIHSFSSFLAPKYPKNDNAQVRTPLTIKTSNVIPKFV